LVGAVLDQAGDCIPDLMSLDGDDETVITSNCISYKIQREEYREKLLLGEV